MAQSHVAAKIDLSEQRFAHSIPWEELRELRRSAPLWWYEEDGTGFWVASSYRIVQEINRDYRRFSNAGGVQLDDNPSSPISRKVLLFMDPPEHTNFRRMATKFFIPKVVAAQEDAVRTVVCEALDDLESGNNGDFAEVVSARVPFRVTAQLLGVPLEDETMILRWLDAIVPSVDPEYRPTPDATVTAKWEQYEYAGLLLDEHRKHPREDLTDQLLGAEIDGRKLPEEDLRSFVGILLRGGVETTRNLLSHALIALFEHPEQQRRLLDGAVAIPTAVEELLRWSSPVMQHSRWPTQEMEIEGQHIIPGQRVTVWMISANRDETVFDSPDVLDLDRDPNPHVTFGAGGPHACIGAPFARLECAVLLEELRSRLPRMRPCGEYERLSSNFFNAIKHLPVRFTA